MEGARARTISISEVMMFHHYILLRDFKNMEQRTEVTSWTCGLGLLCQIQSN